MLKVQRTCDRCGATMEELDYYRVLPNPTACTVSFFDGKETMNYDVCDSCASLFLDFMQKKFDKRLPAPTVNPEPPVESKNVEKSLNDKRKIKLAPGTHTYHKWTKEEDDILLHHSAGKTQNELANMFGCTIAAVASRKARLLSGKD